MYAYGYAERREQVVVTVSLWSGEVISEGNKAKFGRVRLGAAGSSEGKQP